ncbi:hypothetical protein IWW54_004918, partial [Coemansia sp. RSA 2705]
MMGCSTYNAWIELHDAYDIQDPYVIMKGVCNLVNLQMDEDGNNYACTYMSQFDVMLLEININNLAMESIFMLMYIS